jgi:hypothetical protein
MYSINGDPQVRLPVLLSSLGIEFWLWNLYLPRERVQWREDTCS